MSYQHYRDNVYKFSILLYTDVTGKKIRKHKNVAVDVALSGRKLEKELNRIEDELTARFKSEGEISSSTKFADMFEHYIKQSEKEKRLAPLTIERYKAAAQRVNLAIGHKPLESISRFDVQAFIGNLTESGVNKATKGGLSEKSQQLHLNVINAVFKYAIEGGAALSNPAKGVKTIKDVSTARSHNGYVWSKEEAQRFVCALNADELVTLPYKAFYLTAMYTGCREGELLGLTWDDVDFESKTLSINKSLKYEGKRTPYLSQPKTKNSNRLVPVADGLILLLRSVKTEQAKQRLAVGDQWVNVKKVYSAPADFVFSRDNGLPLSSHYMLKKLRTICEQSGVPAVTVHSLRHFYATQLIGCNYDIKTISSLLGHSKTQITLDVYAHAVEENKIKAAQTMAEVIPLSIAGGA